MCLQSLITRIRSVHERNTISGTYTFHRWVISVCHCIVTIPVTCWQQNNLPCVKRRWTTDEPMLSRCPLSTEWLHLQIPELCGGDTQTWSWQLQPPVEIKMGDCSGMVCGWYADSNPHNSHKSFAGNKFISLFSCNKIKTVKMHCPLLSRYCHKVQKLNEWGLRPPCAHY